MPKSIRAYWCGRRGHRRTAQRRLRIYETHPQDRQKAVPVWDKNISDFLDMDKHEECDLDAGV
jgi:hypothetical protein